MENPRIRYRKEWMHEGAILIISMSLLPLLSPPEILNPLKVSVPTALKTTKHLQTKR